MYTVTKQGNQVTLSKASISQSPEDAIIVNNVGTKINPCMDLYATASSVSYDSTNRFSKCYIPWNNVTELTPILIIKGTTATGNYIESGFTVSPEVITDDGNPYFKVVNKDLTSVASDVVVGWKYDLNVILPRTYFRIDDQQTRTDYAASLTIARMKFSVGLSGVLGFKLKSTGIRQGSRVYIGDGTTKVFPWNEGDFDYVDKDQIRVKINDVDSTAFTITGDFELTMTNAPAVGDELSIFLDEWYSLNPVQIADDYLVSDIPLSEQSTIVVPIHQRTDRFQLRIFNDSPFPVSLNSMMWEGNYSPRFYRRT